MRALSIALLGLMISVESLPAADLVKEVRHELLLVRGYTVFDWLAYRVDGSKVTLLGAVVNADLKRDAEKAVKGVEGVRAVQNDIEVLPASAGDDRIRHAILRSIDDSMGVYLSEEVKRIHIIVKNGNVTFEGEVSTQSDKDHATALAKHAQGVHDVTNDLTIQQ